MNATRRDMNENQSVRIRRLVFSAVAGVFFWFGFNQCKCNRNSLFQFATENCDSNLTVHSAKPTILLSTYCKQKSRTLYLRPMSTYTYMGAFVCSSVFVFGNPYTSRVPAGEPSGVASGAIDGTWKLRANNHVFFHVEASPAGYRITRTTRSGTGNYVYRAWTTEIDDCVILNVKDGEKNPEYMLYKLELEGDQLVLTSVSSLNEQQFDNSENLRRYLRSNLHQPGFFDLHDRMVFMRVASVLS